MTTGRFIAQDSWDGDYAKPITLNAWLYGNANPVIYIDPSGMMSCTNSNDPECIASLQRLIYHAVAIKSNVQYGVLPPVEGFALLANYAVDLFGPDIRGMMWGMTRALNGFDVNEESVWRQAKYGETVQVNFIGQNWLPYRNKPDYNNPNWDGTTWIHSLRGEWKKEYWDKTANQAYHFWFYASSTFFDVGGVFWANLGNFIHDVPFKHMAYDYVGSPENEAPPMLDGQQVPSQPDYLLAWAGINYGSQLLKNYELTLLINPCKNNHVPSGINPGDWIRQNLIE
jgi:hypothetical protein